MAASKRKACERETDTGVEIEEKIASRMDDDRLSSLPEALKLSILVRLDTKQAIQTSVLSKTWVSIWTSIPVLKLNNFSFHVHECHKFNKFVSEVLSRRDRLARLDKLTYTNLACSADILNDVFNYAYSTGVKQLQVSIDLIFGTSVWPVRLCDTLTHLKLENNCTITWCQFLVPESILFNNLAVLHLIRVIITENEVFSRFPLLKRLTLRNCRFRTTTTNLKIKAIRLYDLTVSGCNCICEFETPKLRSLTYLGHDFPIHSGLTVLETLSIDLNGFTDKGQEHEKRLIEDTLGFISTVREVKSLTIFSSIVHVLLLFPDELVTGGSPFQRLKDVKLDLNNHICPPLFDSQSRGSIDSVKAYLLHNSPDAKFIITHPKSISCSPLRMYLANHNYIIR